MRCRAPVLVGGLDNSDPVCYPRYMKMSRLHRIIWTILAVMVIASMLAFTVGPALPY